MPGSIPGGGEKRVEIDAVTGDVVIRLAEICMPRTTTVESTLLAARSEGGQSVVMQRVRALYGVGEESAVVSSQ